MRSPFASALAAIPWSRLLKDAPALLVAADALLAKSRRQATQPAGNDLEALRQRIAELEAHQRANADLVKQLADHINAVGLAAEASSARVRQTFYLAIAACGVALIAGFLVLMQ
jgi:hypothetical protein